MNKKRIILLAIIACLALSFTLGIFAVWNHTPDVQNEIPSAQYHFLCLGRDRASHATDLLLLCSYNVAKNQLFCLFLPRDTYFAHGSTTRINAVFAQESASAKDDAEALARTAQVISSALSIPIDYTALVYLDDFCNIIDRIGGVEVDVPFDMDYDDPSQGLSIHLKSGRQVLNGAQSEQFVRFRKGNGTGYKMGDLGRVQAQKLFLASLFAKVKSLSTTQLLSLLPQVLSSVKTNLSLADAAFFLRHAAGLTAESVQVQTASGFPLDNHYILSKPDMAAVMQTHFQKDGAPIPNFDANGVCYDAQRIDHKNRYFSSAVDNSASSLDSVLEDGIDKSRLLRKSSS